VEAQGFAADDEQSICPNGPANYLKKPVSLFLSYFSRHVNEMRATVTGGKTREKDGPHCTDNPSAIRSVGVGDGLRCTRSQALQRK
jgi:hypothetical protein